MKALITSACTALLLFGLSLDSWAAPSRAFTIDDVFKLNDVANAQLSPDGEWIAYEVSSVDVAKEQHVTQLWMASWNGKAVRQLTQGERGGSDPQWSPDGTQLAFLRSGDAPNEDSQIWLLDRQGGEARRVTDLPGGVDGFRWSPDGKRWVLVHEPKPAAPKDADGEDIPQPIVIDRFQFKNDHDGYKHRRTEGRLYLFDIGAGRIQQLTTGDNFAESQPAWSPDGTQIAFVSNRDADAERSQYADIFVVSSTAGATPRRLTDFPGDDTGPLTWSGDGKSIGFLRGDEPRYWLYNQSKLAIVPAAGGATRLPALALDRDVGSPTLSADGRSAYALITDNRIVYPAEIATSDGKVKRLLSSRSVVSSYTKARGRVAVVASEDGAPSELYALESGKLRRLSSHNEAFVKEVHLAPSDDVEYSAADGQKVYGLLTRPLHASAGSKLPLVLWIHGGPYGQDEHSFDIERQLFAANGYAVLQINYRGSNGRGVEFGRGIFADWGNKDVSDLLSGVDHVVASGVADPKRLLVGGWSQGGILTNYIIARDHRFQAAVSGAGAGNQISLYGSDQYVFGYEQEFGTPWENTETWLRISAPFFKAGAIRTPTMYVGGQADFNVPIVGSEQMYQALRSRRIPTQLIIYPGEHHGIRRPSFVRDLLTRYLAWFAEHVKAASAQPSTASGS
ncbi:alpha/beta hydrolase family protein [Steroidobacter sp.]|uniref:S9 family peptidase n=1 Tax=Steroidobacter sp. TaxID=1978227 RepID=UPI001A3C2FA9|nr:S9 family peptidase [Steroidobacter sp.]MBL8271242.1 S9 family peptidase [Steroidobacter sp.]